MTKEEEILKSYYFHSVRLNIEKIEEILKRGAILSRDKLGYELKEPLGFNGNRRISLCKYMSPDVYYNLMDGMRSAYYVLIKHGISFVLDDSISASKTSFVHKITLSNKEYNKIIDDDMELRFSDCLDEYQTTEAIDTSHFIAISYPITEQSNFNERKVKEDLVYLSNLLKKYSLDIPILDVTTNEFEKKLIKLKDKKTLK